MKPNLTQSPGMAPLIIPGDGVHSSANMSRPLQNLGTDWCGISVSRGRSPLTLLRMANMVTSTVSANPQPLAWGAYNSSGMANKPQSGGIGSQQRPASHLSHRHEQTHNSYSESGVSERKPLFVFTARASQAMYSIS